jgi:hypothetical protein
LTVLGLLGEPLLRFDASGVWVNRASPTAAADKLTVHGSGWAKVADGRVFAWHDHRLAPPPGMRPGSRAAWALPVVLEGKRTALRGEFVRVRRPTAWPWWLGAVVTLGVVFAVARCLPRIRSRLGVLLAGVGAFAALAATAGFVAGDPLSSGTQWFELGCIAVLALGALALLRARRHETRVFGATVVGVVAAVFVLPSLNVFWHGVVISALPAWVVRAAIVVAAVAGLAGSALGMWANEQEPVR